MNRLSAEMQTRLAQLFDSTKDAAEMTPLQRQRLQDSISHILSYHAKVGVLGKSGAGTSSLCNALFGRKIAAVDAIEACTREPQDIAFSLESGKGMTLIDMPGVGEDEEHDIEYRYLYENLLPELDLVLWVIKADDRALSPDLHFHDRVIHPYCRKAGIPLLFVINQIDKIDPVREWDRKGNQPGAEQRGNIERKLTVIRDLFELRPNQICAVSATNNHGLVALVEMIVQNLPAEKKWAFTRETSPEHVSEVVRQAAEKGIEDTVNNSAKTACHNVTARMLRQVKHVALTLLWRRL